MPWSNQGGGGGPWQGGGGGQGPWGGRGGGQPPDLEELLRKGQDRVKRVLPGGVGGGRGLLILLVVAVAVWLATGFYRVQPDEQGVELVFGKWVSTTQPGLNYNWPAPIGQVYRPKVTRVNRVEVGFRSGGDTGRGPIVREIPAESLMLTGDENIIDINFVVFWIIKDAGDFLFRIRDPEQTVKAVAESAMREVIGKTQIARALAEGRAEVEVQTRELLQSILDDYQAGITATQVQLQKVDPPAAVIDAFRDVQAARADQERFINEAEAYRNQIVPRAEGEAAKLKQEAEAYKERVVNDAAGKAARFLSVYEAFNQAREVTAKRLYLDAMEKVLTGMNKLFIDKGVGAGVGGEGGVVPYLPLPELRARPSKGATP